MKRKVVANRQEDTEKKEHLLTIFFIDGTSVKEEILISKQQIAEGLLRQFIWFEGVCYNTSHIKKMYVSEIN